MSTSGRMLWDLRHGTRNQDMWVHLPPLTGFPLSSDWRHPSPCFGSMAAEHPSLLVAALLMETLHQKSWLWSCEEWLPCGSVHSCQRSRRQEAADHVHCLPQALMCMHFSRPAVGQHSCASQMKNLLTYHKSGVNSRVCFLAARKALNFFCLTSSIQPLH